MVNVHFTYLQLILSYRLKLNFHASVYNLINSMIKLVDYDKICGSSFIDGRIKGQGRFRIRSYGYWVMIR